MHSTLVCILSPCTSGDVSPYNGLNCVFMYMSLEFDTKDEKESPKNLYVYIYIYRERAGKESLTWENLESTNLHAAVL